MLIKYLKIKKKNIFCELSVNNAEKNPKMNEKNIKNILNRIEDYDEKNYFRTGSWSYWLI